MTDSTTIASTAVAPWRRLPVLLTAGGVLVASLGAAAGWLLRGEEHAAPTPVAAQTEPLTTALAPTAAGKTVQDDEVAPAPRETEPEPKAAPKPAPRRAVHRPAAPAQTGSHQGSGTQSAAVCATCGVVVGVTEVHRKGEGTGLGAVAGGVLGGVVGNQMGGGNGKKALTVLGAVGGGMAGHEIEKRARAEVSYQVHVRMDNGSTRSVTVKNPPAQGARVVVEGQSLRAAS